MVKKMKGGVEEITSRATMYTTDLTMSLIISLCYLAE